MKATGVSCVQLNSNRFLPKNPRIIFIPWYKQLQALPPTLSGSSKISDGSIELISAREELAVCDVTNLPYMGIN